MEPRPDWIIPAWEFGTANGWESIEALITLAPEERPTAVFAWYDGAAQRVLEIAKAHGLRVPQDISVIGYDSTPLCAEMDPPLTSVRQPIREMAAFAASLLARRLREATTAGPEPWAFAPTIDVRSSCGPPGRAGAGTR
jgi:DNA-binding LacI/PurR family transcriptional regulator